MEKMKKSDKNKSVAGAPKKTGRQVNMYVKGPLLEWLNRLSEERGGTKLTTIAQEKLYQVMAAESQSAEATQG
jgi:hypothetical protein